MKHILLLLFICVPLRSLAWNVQYETSDSVKVVKLLRGAKHLNDSANLMIHFAKKLKGVPYVAKTLESNDEENLVVNLRQLDCTTFVENVLALTLCAKNHQERFQDFCSFLRLIRYKDGEVGYQHRLHYFSLWIEDNSRMGYVSEVNLNDRPDKANYTAVQKLNINYMTTHVYQYPMLVKHPEWVADITDLENSLNGRLYTYIPKDKIADNKLFRDIIHDGDIIAILTNKPGLDTSHIGLAIWHKDGLHLFNASSIRKKVVDEPMTLKAYMMRHPSQIGIRIIRVNQYR